MTPLEPETDFHCGKPRRIDEAARAIDHPSLPSGKRQRGLQSTRTQTPPKFWDNLSRIPLCRRALREFDRRTAQPVPAKPTTQFVLLENQWKQLKRFARHGGPNLRDIRGYKELEPQRQMSSRQSLSDKSEMRTKRRRLNATARSRQRTALSSRDPAFEQALVDAQYHPPGHSNREPGNVEEVLERLRRPRLSLSPSVFSHQAFSDFRQMNFNATSEEDVMRDVIPIIRGNTSVPAGGNRLFTNLEPLAFGIATAKPDYYNGSHPSELDSRVRPDGSAAEMKRQITQDLGVGARGMLEMQHYGEENKTYDENAYALGSTYSDGQLKIYICHPTAPMAPGGRPDYHVNQVRSFAMTDTPESFVQGAAAYRNGQDWAEEQRNAVIERVRSQSEAGKVAVKQDLPEHSLTSPRKTGSSSSNSIMPTAESASETQRTSKRWKESLEQAPRTQYI
ncbi:hypothetical protein EV356DRAFT_571524 [Viridothelium virens]|uniref:Uncharacterized protein n=1 Tax=Viridothelium virens TaxID=1048519 RepID=A0A6A6GTF2_VIRVR|nr:hypothetical protein EV356DRAFT_571524 [Viridothelium virens]